MLLKTTDRQVPFQTSAKSTFWPVFHKMVVIRMCVGRLETSESALERFNAVLFEKKIFNFFATFFVRNFPLGFR